ncbi:hypothetical protein [Bradyrhizobium sp. i1.12.3]|uniref:hypothetical protein n=1 Tax=unclassified Bradyrhizobium TaxID=2631580 RepID=UPI003D1B43E3
MTLFGAFSAPVGDLTRSCSEATRLKALGKENAKLKQLMAEQTLDTAELGKLLLE